ncbi:MAG: acyl-CoA thioesterase [Erysipelotrichaceae bacterium]|nr:acyl-CoA thioesterase [Erysipelotrichaceae bacterium]
MREKTTSVQIVLAQHCNTIKKPRLFGGQLMEWIDVTGAVAARRYTGHNVTTASIDNLSFINPAFINDIVVQEAYVTWTGRTSLEVRVDSFVERNGERQEINVAHLVFVALDENDQPTPVPQFLPETDEEKTEYSEALIRRAIRLKKFM